MYLEHNPRQAYILSKLLIFVCQVNEMDVGMQAVQPLQRQGDRGVADLAPRLNACELVASACTGLFTDSTFHAHSGLLFAFILNVHALVANIHQLLH